MLETALFAGARYAQGSTTISHDKGTHSKTPHMLQYLPNLRLLQSFTHEFTCTTCSVFTHARQFAFVDSSGKAEIGPAARAYGARRGGDDANVSPLSDW